MIEREALLAGVALPAAMCGGLLAVGRARWPIPASLAHGGTFCVAFAVLFGWPGFRPIAHWQWVAYAATLATVAGLVVSRDGMPAFARRVVVLLVSVLCAALLTPPWADPRIGWVVALTLAMFALWFALVAIARSVGEAGVCAILMIACVVSARVLLAGGNGKLAQAVAILAAATLGQILAGVRPRASDFDASGLPLFAVLLPGVSILGHFNNYSSVPTAAFVISALLPCAGLVAILKPGKQTPGRGATLLAIGSVLLAGAVLVGWVTLRGGS